MVRKKRPLAIRDLVLMGLFSAILFGVQLAFAFLPNVELVSLLIILYTRHLKYRALPVIYHKKDQKNFSFGILYKKGENIFSRRGQKI